MYKESKIAKQVAKTPALSIPMTEENMKIAPIPEGQIDFMCTMDYTNTDKSFLPKDFNGMVVWRDYLCPTTQQFECGSCWAFSSTTTLADRFNVIAKKKIIPIPSMNFSLLCTTNEDIVDLKTVLSTTASYSSQHDLETKLQELNKSQFACNGNYLITGWCFLYASGTTTDDCLPYVLIDPFKQQYELLDFAFNGRTSFLDTTSAEKVRSENFFFLLDKQNATWSCSNIVGYNKELCWEHTVINNQMMAIPLVHYYVGLIYNIKDDKDIAQAIRYDIYKYGPVSTVMNLFDDFYSFDPVNDGVYATRTDISLNIGGHAVEIVGWGVYKDTPFWWIRNSWSSTWGINGCFRLEVNNKSCGVEANVITGIPNFNFSVDQYDLFLDEFEKTNPIKIKEPYRNCLMNVWMQKYLAIYYKPIKTEYYRKNYDGKRITYFRILAEHPGQKTVLHPQYGVTTKIMSVYPNVIRSPDPDPEIMLYWFRSKRMAGDPNPPPIPWSYWIKKQTHVAWLTMTINFILLLFLFYLAYQYYKKRKINATTITTI